jgi:hypothetical protein
MAIPARPLSFAELFCRSAPVGRRPPSPPATVPHKPAAGSPGRRLSWAHLSGDGLRDWQIRTASENAREEADSRAATQAQQILAAGRVARSPTDAGLKLPTNSIARAIILAGMKRRGELP